MRRERRGSEELHRVGALVVAVLLSTACGSPEAPPRGPGSALWVGPESRPLARAELGRLEGLGVGELFVEAATLHWGVEGAEIAPVAWNEPPRRTRATLVVGGQWPPEGPGGSPAAQRLLPGLQALAAEAERRRLVPVGIHFDLRGDLDGQGLEDYGRFLAEARRRLAPELTVSASLRPEWIDAPGIRRVASATTFVVPFLYGIRPGEREDPAAWDLRRMTESLHRIDALGHPFLIGVVTSGIATVYGPGGEPLGGAPRVGLHHLAWNQSLEPVLGSTLEALDRRADTFRARGAIRVGDLPVPRGGTVRLVGTSTAHLSRLLQEVQTLELAHHRGNVFFSLPTAAEELSLDVPHLISALTGGPTAPILEVDLAATSRAPRRWLLQLTLENRSPEPSALALLDHNFVELEISGGTFGSVDAGEFYRWDLLRTGRDGSRHRALRHATVLRLYAPALAAGARLESGSLEIHLGGSRPPEIAISGRFLAPYGQEATYGPVTWQAGRHESP